MAIKKVSKADSQAETDKYLITLRVDLMNAVNDWRFANRFENKSEAVDWLLDFALQQKPKRPLPPARG